jgi:succinate-semialdehyde dehydrogenase/glutarate-semialdehyde dehydrogenase
MVTTTAQTHVIRPAAQPERAPVGSKRVGDALLERLVMRVTVAETRRAAEVHMPFTGERLGAVPTCMAEDVRLAVHLAREAQRRWAHTTFRERARIFRRVHDRILAKQDEILDLIQLESGKARGHAFEEVADVAIVCRYYARHGDEALQPVRRRGALPLLTATWEHHQPRGVVGFISPWNYPLTLAVTDAIPALLAGNAVVLKPDRQTPFTALWAADLLYEAGLPKDLFQVVTGPGSKLGKPLIEAVDYVGFTGSTATGRTIAGAAGENLIGASLELGGKNPMVVFDDASLDAAARGAVRGCFANAGQLCISIERLYVQSGIYDRFVRRFVELAGELKLGASLDYEADMGSMVSQDQLQVVREHIEDAVAKGARVIFGGKPRPEVGPLFHEPTILEGVEPGMTVFDHETFGPVVSIYRFETQAEAIELANATRYGLNASVWTRNTGRGRKVASHIEAGTVNVNEVYAAAWASVDAPMGGFKESGLGRRHGREGILKYTEPQTIAVQRLLPIAAPPGMSQKTWSKVMTGALRVLDKLPFVR